MFSRDLAKNGYESLSNKPYRKPILIILTYSENISELGIEMSRNNLFF